MSADKVHQALAPAGALYHKTAVLHKGRLDSFILTVPERGAFAVELLQETLGFHKNLRVVYYHLKPPPFQNTCFIVPFMIEKVKSRGNTKASPVISGKGCLNVFTAY